MNKACRSTRSATAAVLLVVVLAMVGCSNGLPGRTYDTPKELLDALDSAAIECMPSGQAPEITRGGEDPVEFYFVICDGFVMDLAVNPGFVVADEGCDVIDAMPNDRLVVGGNFRVSGSRPDALPQDLADALGGEVTSTRQFYRSLC